MFSCKATQRSTQALGAAQGACAAERFTGAHPPSRAGPLSDYKVAVDASVRRRSGCMCRRKVRCAHPSQQSWAPSVHKATDGHAFRRHMRPELFALQGFISLRLHLPEEELDGVLHEAGDGHRTYAARNWCDN